MWPRMKIGLTYDLRDEYLARGYSLFETAEFDRPDTIDAIQGAIESLGFEVDRIGSIHALVRRLALGERWDLVFNIAEGLYGMGREAQVPAILDAYRIPYTFSDPTVLSLCLNKAMSKHILRDLGIPTPDFAVIYDEDDINSVDLNLPLFAKPLAEGTGKGVSSSSVIRSIQGLHDICMELLSMYRQPILLERFLPGREFTVGIVGTGNKARAIGTLEVVLLENAEQDVYSYENKERCEDRVEYRLVDDSVAREAEEIALKAWRALGCRDAGRVDLRQNEEGQVHFMEVNPLAGLHPRHSDLPILCSKRGIAYGSLIGAVIESALERSGTPLSSFFLH